MPNDLVSREAVMAAVEDAFSDSIISHVDRMRIRTAIAALPAAGAERLEKLRVLSALQHSLYPDCFLEGLGDAINDMRRSYLSPPPQEAGDDHPGHSA